MHLIPEFSALQVMQDAPVIPVIVLSEVAHAVPLARALVAGGVRMLEVTLRTPHSPAQQAGGPALFQAWSGPFFDVKFCPTGGVTLQNAPDFLALSNVVCVGGSWLVPAQALGQGDWPRVTQLARETLALKKKDL